MMELLVVVELTMVGVTVTPRRHSWWSLVDCNGDDGDGDGVDGGTLGQCGCVSLHSLPDGVYFCVRPGLFSSFGAAQKETLSPLCKWMFLFVCLPLACHPSVATVFILISRLVGTRQLMGHLFLHSMPQEFTILS